MNIFENWFLKKNKQRLEGFSDDRVLDKPILHILEHVI